MQNYYKINNKDLSYFCSIMKWAYLVFIKLYPLIAWLISPFNRKAALWVSGRKNLLEKIRTTFSGNQDPVIWIHAASLGEFEQGLPIAEQLKKEYPGHRILITFFSPSGYENKKNHPVADWVFYLPMDSARNAKLLIEYTRPKLAIFIKYEFWYYYLKTLHNHNIPVLLVSGIFRPTQLFFKPLGGFYRSLLQYFRHLFLQDQGSATLLKPFIAAERMQVSGDTRFDRVIDIATAAKSFPEIVQFADGLPLIIAGSTWSEDDKVLHHFAISHPEVKWIIAPHHIEEDRLNECLRFYPSAVLYSVFTKANKEEQQEAKTIVIDNIGILSQLYQYATIAFIGGGFTSQGIHNTIEAAIFGKPIIFGPVYDKYLEAIELIETGGAISVENTLELEQTFNMLLQEKDERYKMEKASVDYVKAKAGATAQIKSYIQEKRLLIN